MWHLHNWKSLDFSHTMKCLKVFKRFEVKVNGSIFDYPTNDDYSPLLEVTTYFLVLEKMQSFVLSDIKISLEI